MKEIVTLNRKEQKRLVVLNQVGMGKLVVGQAAEVLELSPRQVWRLLVAYRKEGATALAHGNRGRKPYNALDDNLREQVLKLAQSIYAGCNTQHFTELLAERGDIILSRSSVRRILLAAGIRSPRKRRPPKHRSRRERYPQEGMLLQIDGSPHDWLEGRGPWLSLIGAIDDATGKVLYAIFREQEDSKGYFLLIQEIVLNYGIPLALYHDRHSIFEMPGDKLPSIEEQLEGKRPLTQLGRLMEELGITSIPAFSPQAKGRIERLWGTFQDRLVSELRLAGAKTMDESNQVLVGFLPRYNQRFAVPAREPGLAYRRLDSGFKPEEFFCFKYQRTVGADNVVRFGEQRLQVLPSEDRLSYTRCKVEVQERLDGSLAVYYQGCCLSTRPAPLEPAKLREPVLTGIATQRRYPKPAPDHPWRGIYRTFFDK
jgi:transposase